MAALHASSNIFAHHQELLNGITATGITHTSLPAGIMGFAHDTSWQRHTC